MTENPGLGYPSNSHKAREKKAEPPAKNVERVTQGEAIQRRKPLGRKLAETFTGDDARSAGTYILMEVMVPALKNMISDAVSQGVERILFGDSRPRTSSRTGYTNYNKLYSSTERRTISPRARARHDFGEIVLATRADAEEVLERITALIEQYSVASVSDLYELVGITGNYTDDKWGWSDIRGARVRAVREGFLLDLPQPHPLD